MLASALVALDPLLSTPMVGFFVLGVLVEIAIVVYIVLPSRRRAIDERMLINSERRSTKVGLIVAAAIWAMLLIGVALSVRP